MTGGPRDDMVIRPRLGPARSPAQRVASEHRAGRKIGGRRSPLGTFVRRRLALTALRAAGSGLRAAGGVAAAAGGVARGAAAAASSTTAIATVLVVAAVVAVRLGTGRSFENMEELVKSGLLGDLSPEAMAKQATRRQMQAHENIMAIAGREGITTQMRAMGARLYKVNLLEAKGAAAFMRDPTFQVNGLADMLILRGWARAKAAFRGSGGDQSVIDLKNALRIRQLGGIYK